VSNIREWLQGLGLGKYAEVFEENEIDLEAARLLDSEDLKEMGLPIGPRKKILAALPNAAVTAAEVRTEEEPAEAKVSGSGRGAERRRLTVMFCDMVGSTALAEKLDPEDLRALMQTYQQACGTVIARYDGHVAQYLGDGLMVYFGWPAAHEDDAERAVRAGLDMVRAVKSVEAPEPVRVRIGIATGPVVVGETGAGDASVPKLAVGETPNLAARAQGLANADDIVVIESTHREAGSAFVYEDLGERILKGIVEPIRCWRVKGLDKARTQLDETMSEGLTPFVGRERELATLEERLADAEGGQGRVIVLVGEPGVGKSRLLHEFRRRNGSRVAWAEGRAISFGQSMAFHPLIDLLRGNFRIDVDDQPEVVREKVTAGMGRVAADLLPSATYVQYLLGVARDEDPVLRMDPKLRRAEIFDTLRRLLLMAAERRSQVLLFEDLHWSDTATTATSRDSHCRILHRAMPSASRRRCCRRSTSRPSSVSSCNARLTATLSSSRSW